MFLISLALAAVPKSAAAANGPDPQPVMDVLARVAGSVPRTPALFQSSLLHHRVIMPIFRSQEILCGGQASTPPKAGQSSNEFVAQYGWRFARVWGVGAGVAPRATVVFRHLQGNVVVPWLLVMLHLPAGQHSPSTPRRSFPLPRIRVQDCCCCTV
jgi:hypothetical protein